MGNETRWPRSSVSFDTPPLQKGGLHFAHPGIYIEEELGCRAALCDCHCGPMYYLSISLMPKGAFVMCWVSECGPRNRVFVVKLMKGAFEKSLDQLYGAAGTEPRKHFERNQELT
jgi:hypothetical protein